jgi:hypothetical protein
LSYPDLIEAVATASGALASRDRHDELWVSLNSVVSWNQISIFGEGKPNYGFIRAGPCAVGDFLYLVIQPDLWTYSVSDKIWSMVETDFKPDERA